MNRTRTLTLVTAALAWAVGCGTAFADGTMLVRAPDFMREHQQYAYLDWEEESGTERLTIKPGFRGDARDFVWIVPVPAEPRIEASDAAIFRSLQAATDPIHRRRDEGWDCDGGGVYSPQESADIGVVIMSDLVIDVYRVLVLSATSAGTLADSLRQWGHLHDGNVEEVTPLLEDYVSEGWSFVAARVDSAAYVAAYPHATAGRWYTGALKPLLFEFDADRPVYPMRLSRVSADAETWVELYVEANHRYEHPRLEAVYANRFSSGEIDALRSRSPLVADQLETGRFLTRLQGVVSPAQMTEDFYVRRAGDDREFRPIRYSGWPTTSLLFGGMVLAWAVQKRRRRRRNG